MRIDITQLQNKICQSLCAEVRVIQKRDDLVLIDTPFFFSDGDPYQIYLKELPTGSYRMTDCGHTFMHLSYENDITKFNDGTRNRILQEIIGEYDIILNDGEVYYDFPMEQISKALFRFGQALTKINDLTFLNRVRAESTFYENLQEIIFKTVDNDKVCPDYIYDAMPDAKDYPIDYKIEAKEEPLFVFGIPGRDKGRLVTIILERLLRHKANFNSLLIFANQPDIPRPDLARLSNVGGEMISSLDAREDIHRKLIRQLH
jgi:hypothetical protein